MTKKNLKKQIQQWILDYEYFSERGGYSDYSSGETLEGAAYKLLSTISAYKLLSIISKEIK